jgi:hypothetical protein
MTRIALLLWLALGSCVRRQADVTPTPPTPEQKLAALLAAPWLDGGAPPSLEDPALCAV